MGGTLVDHLMTMHKERLNLNTDKEEIIELKFITFGSCIAVSYIVCSLMSEMKHPKHAQLISQDFPWRGQYLLLRWLSNF